MMMTMMMMNCRFAEWMVAISFLVLALTWLTKKPGVFDGWIYLFLEKRDDASVSTTLSLCLVYLLTHCCHLLGMHLLARSAV